MSKKYKIAFISLMLSITLNGVLHFCYTNVLTIISLILAVISFALFCIGIMSDCKRTTNIHYVQRINCWLRDLLRKVK